MKTYKYEDWDIQEGTELYSWNERVYVDLEGNLITGMLEGYYGFTTDTGDKRNCQYVENGRRVIK